MTSFQLRVHVPRVLLQHHHHHLVHLCKKKARARKKRKTAILSPSSSSNETITALFLASIIHIVTTTSIHSYFKNSLVILLREKALSSLDFWKSHGRGSCSEQRLQVISITT